MDVPLEMILTSYEHSDTGDGKNHGLSLGWLHYFQPQKSLVIEEITLWLFNIAMDNPL